MGFDHTPLPSLGLLSVESTCGLSGRGEVVSIEHVIGRVEARAAA